MQAIVAISPGGPEVLEVTTIDNPALEKGQVLIDVAAAGVNRADILQRQGHYPPPPGASPIIGLEVAGTISALSTEIEGWSVGDRVCALLAGGGYAGKVAVSASQLLPVPQGMDLITAAALPEALCTIYYNLVIAAGLSGGETILIHGGGGGIGTAAIQIAKSMGARVACTAGSEPKLAKAQALGADILINYREQDFVAAMRELGGADVILDIMGAAYLGRNVDALRANGRLVVIGLQGGRKGELDLAKLLSKQAVVRGTTLRGLPLSKKEEIVAGVRRDYWPMVRDGTYVPHIDRVLPLSNAAEAHRLIESGGVTGKIVLEVAGAGND
ncbi:MAG TPA: NAD(P)H-quinone oxidoreductase [Sphingomonadaceae bacterium]|nr:NAD(P)H-quinone oxidoreductase [Sphingomonadaceae bacterium]